MAFVGRDRNVDFICKAMEKMLKNPKQKSDMITYIFRKLFKLKSLGIKWACRTEVKVGLPGNDIEELLIGN